ncbi:hypothetical protein [Enterococcus nangangensis]|uniref:hypothetical protein n=1 Tax=Enterococcus nangangensis TaxID=2559926 RepID=UPI0010F89F49|nr:hypothetical protein [Enterococcus nangangensis]
MKQNFKFEVRTFLKSKTYLLFFSIFLLMFIWPSIQTSLRKPEKDKAGAAQVYLDLNGIAGKQLQSWELAKPATSPVNPSVEDLKHEQELVQPISSIYYFHPEEKVAFTKATLAFDQFFLQELVNGRRVVGYEQLQFKKAIAEKEYLLAENIESVYEKNSTIPAFNQAVITLEDYTPVLWVLMVLGLNVGYYLIDDKRKGAIDMVNLFPTSKGLVMFNKQIVFLLVTVVSLALSFGLSFLFSTVTSGVGSSQYPLTYTLDGQSAAVMTIGSFLLKYGLLILGILIFLIGVSCVVQLFTTNILVSLIILVCMVMLGATSNASTTVMTFIPTSYFNFLDIILPQTGRVVDISVTRGIYVLGLWGVLLCAASIFIAHKRQRI